METEKTQNNLSNVVNDAQATTTEQQAPGEITEDMIEANRQTREDGPEIAPTIPQDPEPAPKEEQPKPVQEQPKPEPIKAICNPDVKSFEPKEEARIIKALSKLGDYSGEPPTIEQALKKENLYFMEKSQICMVEAISEEAKRVLYKFASVNEFAKYPKNILEIYTSPSPALPGGLYSMEYLAPILNLMGKGGYIKIFSYKDKPAVIENKHFRVFLAPCSIGDDE